MRNRHLRGYKQLRMNNFDEKVADAIARRLWSYRHGVARIAKGPKPDMTMQLSIIEKFFFSVIQYNELAHSLIWYYKHCPRIFPLLYCGKTINLFSQYVIYVFSVLFFSCDAPRISKSNSGHMRDFKIMAQVIRSA